MNDTTGTSLCEFDKPSCGSESEICKLIIIGLEGVGKTTLVNHACGEKYDTSDGREGCAVKNNQKGSFRVDGFRRLYELIDMLGINYKNPGEWQRALHGRSEVHGVIFFISGANPRESALGELPRIGEYCLHLGIPVLYIYRDGQLSFKPAVHIHSETHEDVSETETNDTVYKTVFVRYQNLDEVKRFIAQTFEKATKFYQLLDPIVICRQVRLLNEEKKKLQETIHSLEDKFKNQSEAHQENVTKLERNHMEEISRLQKLLDDTRENYLSLKTTLNSMSNVHEQALRELRDQVQKSAEQSLYLQITLKAMSDAKDSLEQKCSELGEQNRTLELDCRYTREQLSQLRTDQHELQRNIEILRKARTKLSSEEKILRDKKDSLERRIKSASQFLNEKLEGIVNIVQNSPELPKKIKSKKFDAGGKWMWLPWRAYDVIEKYNELAKNVKKLVVILNKSLTMMESQAPSNITYSDNSDDEQPDGDCEVSN